MWGTHKFSLDSTAVQSEMADPIVRPLAVTVAAILLFVLAA